MQDGEQADGGVAERQMPSPHGAALGRALAGVADEMAARHPMIPQRCESCAFRLGTIPNQLAGTLVLALNCVTGHDPAPFGCHQTLAPDGLPTQLCAGYVLARQAPMNMVAEACVNVLEELGDEKAAAARRLVADADRLRKVFEVRVEASPEELEELKAEFAKRVSEARLYECQP